LAPFSLFSTPISFLRQAQEEMALGLRVVGYFGLNRVVRYK
jgi:hypothetical protein